MTEVQMPTRKWGDEDEAEPVVPIVLISSRDEVPPPVEVAAVTKLVKAAEANGWRAEVRYALASVGLQMCKNGKIKKHAHLLASIAVLLRREHRERGYALWTLEVNRAGDITAIGWRFTRARLASEEHGAKSIVERLAVAP